jgi:hypothetical protein
MFYDQAILIQWLKEWRGVPPVFSVSSDTGGTPVPLCASTDTGESSLVLSHLRKNIRDVRRPFIQLLPRQSGRLRAGFACALQVARLSRDEL